MTPEAADAISRLSPFAIFVFLVGLAGIGLWRRWWVPGFFYEQERTGRVTAETQALRNAEALEKNNTSLANQSRQLAAIRREQGELRNDVRRLVSGSHERA